MMGGEARIVGLSQGTASLVNSVAFVSFDDFRQMRGNAAVVSYVLVRVSPGAASEAVARQIEVQVPDVTALSRPVFAAEERRLVTDMSADVIAIMSVVGFVIALAVVALTVYVATLSRRREYGVLKALGARNGGWLYRVVLVQAGLSVPAGFLVGLLFTGLLTMVMPLAGSSLALALSLDSLVKVGLFATAIAGLSAVVPIRQVAGVDPAVVLRRGVTP